jgi:hypothetical protein
VEAARRVVLVVVLRVVDTLEGNVESAIFCSCPMQEGG